MSVYYILCFVMFSLTFVCCCSCCIASLFCGEIKWSYNFGSSASGQNAADANQAYQGYAEAAQQEPSFTDPGAPTEQELGD